MGYITAHYTRGGGYIVVRNIIRIVHSFIMEETVYFQNYKTSKVKSIPFLVHVDFDVVFKI